jgi:eukaryotic-like serine/threonine-protein kinase
MLHRAVTLVQPLAAGLLVADRYRLDRCVGEGGMGTVWAAQHVVTRKRVALKFLLPEMAASEEVRTRFVREARAASAINHPNIVQMSSVVKIAADK